MKSLSPLRADLRSDGGYTRGDVRSGLSTEIMREATWMDSFMFTIVFEELMMIYMILRKTNI